MGWSDSQRHARMAASVAGETTATRPAWPRRSRNCRPRSGHQRPGRQCVADRREATIAPAGRRQQLGAGVDRQGHRPGCNMITAIAARPISGAERDDRSGARGEAGRGFAVVAQEVKALATQTTKALRDQEQDDVGHQRDRRRAGRDRRIVETDATGEQISGASPARSAAGSRRPQDRRKCRWRSRAHPSGVVQHFRRQRPGAAIQPRRRTSAHRRRRAQPAAAR